MAAKIILLASLHIITKSVLSAPALTTNDDLCKCEVENSDELEELWKFFKEIDSKLEELPVVPGELSPNIPCSNCIEYNRQKRKILPADMEERDSSEEVPHPAAERKGGDKSVKTEEDSDMLESEEHNVDNHSEYDQILNPRLGQFDKNCPEGTSRVGIWCVSELELSDDDYYE